MAAVSTHPPTNAQEHGLRHKRQRVPHQPSPLPAPHPCTHRKTYPSSHLSRHPRPTRTSHPPAISTQRAPRCCNFDCVRNIYITSAVPMAGTGLTEPAVSTDPAERTSSTILAFLHHPPCHLPPPLLRLLIPLPVLHAFRLSSSSTSPAP